jgi:hypothetical protein
LPKIFWSAERHNVLFGNILSLKNDVTTVCLRTLQGQKVRKWMAAMQFKNCKMLDRKDLWDSLPPIPRGGLRQSEFTKPL